MVRKCILFSFLTVACRAYETLKKRHTQDLCPIGSIIDENEKYCCPSSCGRCGGYGCHELDGGEFHCCWSKFTEFCDESGSAPCILPDDSSDDPPIDNDACPSGSVIDETEKYCCPSSCGECGGYGCHENDGGEFNCCWSTFTAYCDESGSAPCILSDDKPPVDSGLCPAGSVIDESEKYCCPSSCGQCGGYGCHELEGGEFNCCWSKFTSSCDDVGAPPCILSDPAEPVEDDSCPSGSIPDESEMFCCPESCSQCGGDGCTDEPFSASNCCTESIVSSCNVVQPPCKVAEEPEYVCAKEGLLAEIPVYFGCALRVCCPASCNSCDSSENCTGPPECCALEIAKPIVTSDVDVSCRDHDPPCIVPPGDDPCTNNPCQNGARCGYALWGGYGDDTQFCRSYTVCECRDLDGAFAGEFCEIECGEGETACGYQSIPVGFLTGVYNEKCCSADQECVTNSRSSVVINDCYYIDRPTTCSPNPCLNGAECIPAWPQTSCSCPEGFTGGLCQTPIDT